MLRILLAFFVVIIACSSGQAQDIVDASADTAGLARMTVLSRWLIEYEEVSLYMTEEKEEYKKTPIVRAGQTGFAYQDGESSWHVFSGKMSEGNFIPTMHRILLQDGKISEGSLEQNPDLSSYASALQNCYASFKEVTDTIGVHFNQFIRKKAEGEYEVYFLPAFQPSGQAIYGCEWKGIWDSKLKKVKDVSLYCAGVKGIWIGQPRVLWLNYRDCKAITLGGVFFMEYFQSFFKTINLDTQLFTLSKSEEGIWNLKKKAQ